MATSASNKSASDQARDEKQSENTGRGPRTATVSLPFVTATFRMPELPSVRLPSRAAVGSAVSVARPYLPSPQQALYYGGLAALTAFELIEWPVALAIGASTALVQRSMATTSPRSPITTSPRSPITTSPRQAPTDPPGSR